MPASSYKFLSDGRGDGVVVNRSNEVLAFYGKTTGASQASAITKPGTTASTSSSPVGYGTTTQADAIVTAVRALIDVVANIGLTA